MAKTKEATAKKENSPEDFNKEVKNYVMQTIKMPTNFHSLTTTKIGDYSCRVNVFTKDNSNVVPVSKIVESYFITKTGNTYTSNPPLVKV